MTAFDDIMVEAEGRGDHPPERSQTLNAISPRMMGGLSQAFAH
jgi:hypothetical protein